MAPRRYEQRLRAEHAAQTRQRILDAVLERLRDAPAEPIAIERIAGMAGVARSTVYAIFGSRAGLFDAVGADLFQRAGYARVIEATRHPDAREQLRGGLRTATEMFAAHRDIVRALHSMAQLDEQAVGGAVRRMEDERAAGMARLAHNLHEQGQLRPEIGVAQAEHILWVLTSFDSFDLLRSGRGLTTDAIADLLTQSAEHALCVPDPSCPSTSATRAAD